MTSRLRPLERADAARLAALITGYRAAMGAGGSATSEPEARRLIASAEADANILLIGAEAGAGLAGSRWPSTWPRSSRAGAPGSSTTCSSHHRRAAPASPAP